MDYDQLFEEFNVGAARQICLGSEVRSRTEHELELKEKLRVKYDARGVLLKEKDMEIARLKSLVQEKETESAEVSRLRDQVSVLTAEKSSLSAEVSVLKSVVSQKETDISLLDSRTTYLKSALDDSQAACNEARNLISTLSSERDGLASEVSTLHSAFRDLKEKMEAQQECVRAQALYKQWLLTHGMTLAMVKCLKSPKYQGILGHALGRAVDFGMQEGLAAVGYLLIGKDWERQREAKKQSKQTKKREKKVKSQEQDKEISQKSQPDQPDTVELSQRKKQRSQITSQRAKDVKYSKIQGPILKIEVSRTRVAKRGK
ncbi:hypothetical protein Tco_0842073 [Tanacetum coccineum]|uniref:Uncharacterized protein n=1 Tax=Tanacetum coccineum TaxID=301880 RepID=A0ABQ5AY81_9ASTR